MSEGIFNYMRGKRAGTSPNNGPGASPGLFSFTAVLW